MPPLSRQVQNQVGRSSSTYGGGYALRITPGIHPTYGGNNVNHGYFYNNDSLTNVTGIFFCEGWVMPQAGAEYWFSDGHGGAHKLLCGFNGADPGPLAISGNIWNPDGAAVVSFTSIDTVPANTLCHVAVGWDGSNIVVYLQGVRTGVTAYTGNRGNTGSTGTGFVGGSDHSGFKGWLFRIRIFEGVLPFTNGLPTGYFVAEKTFRAAFRNTSSGALIKASALWDYTTPSRCVPDLSSGYDGSVHPGVLSLGNNDNAFQEAYKDVGEQYLPKFEPKRFEQTAYLGTAPTTTPATAILFDEFRRKDNVPSWYLASDATLRTAPTGQVWSSNTGIISEKAFLWANSSDKITISAGTPNLDITFTNGNTAKKLSYIFRLTDANNYLVIETGLNQGQYDVYLKNYTGGSPTTEVTAAQALANETFSTLRIVANGTSVTVYVNGVQKLAGTTSRTTGNSVGVSMDTLCRLDKVEAYAV